MIVISPIDAAWAPSDHDQDPACWRAARPSCACYVSLRPLALSQADVFSMETANATSLGRALHELIGAMMLPLSNRCPLAPWVDGSTRWAM